VVATIYEWLVSCLWYPPNFHNSVFHWLIIKLYNDDVRLVIECWHSYSSNTKDKLLFFVKCWTMIAFYTFVFFFFYFLFNNVIIISTIKSKLTLC
jgi:hypothetical protein